MIIDTYILIKIIIKKNIYFHFLFLYFLKSLCFEDRKFKQLLSVIPPILTKRTQTCHLNSLNTMTLFTTYGVRNPSSGLCQAQRCGGVKPVNGIITLPFLKIGSSTPIQIFKNNRKNTCIKFDCIKMPTITCCYLSKLSLYNLPQVASVLRCS